MVIKKYSAIYTEAKISHLTVFLILQKTTVVLQPSSVIHIGNK